jgi:D-glycero-D-manno-heptose 1,7-bisphosphate phosphatase
MTQPAVFLDRDGVLNEERGDYTYLVQDFIIPKGVPEALANLKAAGYLLIVVTNQGGIAKGLYTKKEVIACHHYLQEQVGQLLDALYYSPHHQHFSNSLSRKPQTLMLEKAVAKFQIDLTRSWMIGDSARDIEAGLALGLQTILIQTENKNGDKAASHQADYAANNLLAASEIILINS